VDRLWKKIERRVAEYWGFRRVPVAEQQGFDVVPKDYYYHDDMVGGAAVLPLGFEVKEAKSFPKWFLDATRQAQRHATKHGGKLVPAVVFAQKGSRAGDYAVVMRMEDLRDLLARLTPAPAPSRPARSD
jgi:hypothetical protein